MRKRRGTILILSGLLLLLGAAGLTLSNVNREITAGEDAEAVTAALTEILNEAPSESAPAAGSAADSPAAPAVRPATASPLPAEDPAPVELDGRQYLGLITIPALALQLPVQAEWSYQNLRISPCRMSGSLATEDLVILGHNYRTHFGSLRRLEVGDEVSLTLADGVTYVYQVDAKEVVSPTAVESVTSGEWPLTLFTCTVGGQTRLVIRCDPAGQEAE